MRVERFEEILATDGEEVKPVRKRRVFTFRYAQEYLQRGLKSCLARQKPTKKVADFVFQKAFLMLF